MWTSWQSVELAMNESFCETLSFPSFCYTRINYWDSQYMRDDRTFIRLDKKADICPSFHFIYHELCLFLFFVSDSMTWKNQTRINVIWIYQNCTLFIDHSFNLTIDYGRPMKGLFLGDPVFRVKPTLIEKMWPTSYS